MVTWRDESLPHPGDAVLVDWGLNSVPAVVLESYRSGPRVQVSVELSLGEGVQTLTVPVGAVQPLESADSPWAKLARYESQFHAALLAVLGRHVVRAERNVVIDGAEIDLLLRFRGQGALAVELKMGQRPLTSHNLEKALDQLSHVIQRQGWLGLFASRAPLVKLAPVRSRLALAHWAGPDDNLGLNTALRDLPGLGEWLSSPD